MQFPPPCQAPSLEPHHSPNYTLFMKMYLEELFSTLVVKKNQDSLGALEFVLSFCLWKGHGKVLGKIATNTMGFRATNTCSKNTEKKAYWKKNIEKKGKTKMASLPCRNCLASLHPPLLIAQDENRSRDVSWPQELDRQASKAVVPASYAHNFHSNAVCKSQRWISFNPPQFYSFHLALGVEWILVSA